MIITQVEATKFMLTEVKGLDPIKVFTEDIAKGKGQITITCYGQAWTAYFGGIGDSTIAEFFCSCDEHYLAGKLSDIDSKVYDLEAIQAEAKKKGIECWRDDPWHDYDFLKEMYGPDMYEWSCLIPKTLNHKYEYLCKIIKAVQQGLAEELCIL